LIGSDSRAGANGKGTGAKDVGGARSDTTIIMHIAADNAGATLISIPRDSYVDIPSCVIGPNNELSSPGFNKFNAAFSIGATNSNKYAASCTVHTIETLTGIHIDHYAVIDFVGFKKMVDALGGVRMCVAKPLDDPIVYQAGVGYHGSGLNLPEGPSVEISGAQALDLMRARYALDGGGDLPRIKRQQEFMAAMIRKATSSGLLVHPLSLQHFLTSAAGSVTTDGFGLKTMEKLANALHSAGAGSIRLLTVPNIVGGGGVPSADVEWDPTKAPQLWYDIRHDLPLPGTKTKKAKATASTSPSPSPSKTPTPKQSGPPLSVSPSGITVNVENGTPVAHLAHTVADDLAAQGFQIGTIGNSDQEDYVKTTIEYGPDKVQSSQTVEESIPGSTRELSAYAGETITVIIGSDYTGVIPVKVGGSTATSSTSSTTSPSPSSTPSIESFAASSHSCLS
jgi:LCP family protein required for cell wall assembly